MNSGPIQPERNIRCSPIPKDDSWSSLSNPNTTTRIVSNSTTDATTSNMHRIPLQQQLPRQQFPMLLWHYIANVTTSFCNTLSNTWQVIGKTLSLSYSEKRVKRPLKVHIILLWLYWVVTDVRGHHVNCIKFHTLLMYSQCFTLFHLSWIEIVFFFILWLFSVIHTLFVLRLQFWNLFGHCR